MASSARPTLSKRGNSGKVTAPDAPSSPPDEPAIDQLLADLERVVTDLESGELPLETALQRFETGVRLARRGTALLDAVEQRVEVLLDGRDAPAPFPGADPPQGDDDDETF